MGVKPVSGGDKRAFRSGRAWGRSEVRGGRGWPQPPSPRKAGAASHACRGLRAGEGLRELEVGGEAASPDPAGAIATPQPFQCQGALGPERGRRGPGETVPADLSSVTRGWPGALVNLSLINRGHLCF